MGYLSSLQAGRQTAGRHRRAPEATLKTTAIIAAALILLYALFGYFIAPGLVKTRLLATVRAQTGLEASLGEVSVRPFALAVTLRDFSLPDRRGERFTSFREFHVNFEVSSLWRGGYVFSDVRMVQPYVRFISRSDGSTNLEDVMLPGADTANSPRAPEQPTTVFVDRLEIAKAVIEYEDRQRPTPFAMRVDSLDLELRDFATRPDDSGDYQFEAVTHKGESLQWRGKISLFPFRSAGHLALGGLKARTGWEYVQDRFEFEVNDGQIDLAADYDLDFAAEPVEFNVRNGQGSVRSLNIIDRRDTSQAVYVSHIEVSGMEAQAKHPRLRLARVVADSAVVMAALQPDSTFTLATLFLPKADTAADTTAPWRVAVDSLEVSRCALLVDDRTTDPQAHLEVVDARLTLADYVYGEPGRTAQLQAAAHFRTGGDLTAEGTYVPEPFDVQLDVKLDDLALPAFQPYVNAMGKLDVLTGAMSLAGRYGLHGDAMATTFDGDVAIVDFRAVDRVLNEDFLRWDRLDVRRTRFSEQPPRLAIAEVALLRPYIRMIVGPDRTTNVQHIMGKVPDSALPADSVASPGVSVPADTTPAFPIEIGVVSLAEGTLNFSDFSMRPNFSVGIEDLHGAITGLSSEAIDSAVVELDGKVDRYAPASIRGLVNPLTDSSFSDLTMKFQSIELTSFSPYSGRFLGYKIDKGKLHLDLHYVLRGRQLESENKIIIDQLTLGEKVESSDAMGLPLKLAVALLKDSHGVIDLDIPVKGSLDDPQFSVMPIVWKIVKNLLIKAVTSPFKLLGALFGGDEQDLEYVNFAPGTAVLAPTEQSKLDSLARALLERPGLKLDVRGAAVRTLDSDTLARQAVTAQLLQADSAFAPGALTKAQRERLYAQYRVEFAEDPYLLVPEKDSLGQKLPKEVREPAVQHAAFARLVGHYEVSDNELRLLAQGRAMTIKDRLVLHGGVEEVRVFLQDAEVDAEEVLGEVRMRLALDAR